MCAAGSRRQRAEARAGAVGPGSEEPVGARVHKKSPARPAAAADDMLCCGCEPVFTSN